MKDADMVDLAAQLRGLKQYAARRAWFRSDKGASFRMYCSPTLKHEAVRTSRGICVHCSKTTAVVDVVPGADAGTAAGTKPRAVKKRRLNQGGTGYKSLFKCSLCGVRLCRKSGRHNRNCWDEWHDGAPVS